MHVLIAIRGIVDNVEKFIKQLSSIYLPFKWRNQSIGEKELKDYNLQMRVSPVQIYDISFPSEHKDLLYATLFPNGKGGPPIQSGINKYIFLLRKLLGLREVSKYKTDRKFPLFKESIEIVGIGEKDDYWVTRDNKHIDKKEEGAYEGI